MNSLTFNFSDWFGALSSSCIFQVQVQVQLLDPFFEARSQMKSQDLIQVINFRKPFYYFKDT